MIRGFYAVIDRDDVDLARTILDAGARIIQLRMKAASAREIVIAGKKLRALCDELGATFVMNDRVDLAIATRADAVHLGQTDLPITEARKISGDMKIGVSTHNLDQVRAAIAAGADYLGYGPVFATSTKVNPDPTQGLGALAAAVKAAGTTPVVAIGGITPERAKEVYVTGVAGLCAIGAVLTAADPGAVVRELCA